MPEKQSNDENEMMNLKCEYKEKINGKFEIECHRTIDKENLCNKFCKKENK